jgi:5-(carboxyamino)imidazole ribonucleotide synthase
MSHEPKPLPPGATIGILGGGQLGRMLALAAARLGLKCHIYSDVADAPAFDCAAARTVAPYTDAAAIVRFAASVGAVTYEFENVPVAAADAAAPHAPVYPPREALARTQDRVIEKQLVAGLGLPVAPFEAIDGVAGLRDALKKVGPRPFLKTRRFGYDGKGQVVIEEGSDPAVALAALGGVPAILEGRVAFAREVSVIGVRGRDGEVRHYDTPHNTHEDGILRRSVIPSGLPERHQQRAREMATEIMVALGYVGVIGVEMFWLGEDASEPLVINEIAPRVHNSGHWTIDACGVSQFENHIRAVAGWPLGSTVRHSDCEMENLLGEETHGWASLAAERGTCIHLYGKSDARPGRKMGHVTRLRP